MTEWDMAMITSHYCWRGTSIAEGAIAILKKVSEIPQLTLPPRIKLK